MVGFIRAAARISGLLRLLLGACVLAAHLRVSECTTRDLGLRAHQHHSGEQDAEDPLALTPLPPCALVYFVHVHKTGGTTIRDWVAKGQFGEWNIYGWEDRGGSKLVVNGYCTGNHCNNGVDFLVDVATTDPAQYAAEHGRVFMEDHGSTHDVRPALRKVQSLQNNTAWVEYGCKAVTFTIMREPKKYLISLARSHYKYCPFYDLLMHRNGGPVGIWDSKWRYDLMNVSHYLDNMEIRQLGMWASENHQYSAFNHFPKTVAWYNAPVDRATVARVFDMMTNCFDVVGLTHQIPQLLLILSDLAGFQHIKDEPTNTGNEGAESIYKQHEWYNDEMDMLNKVAVKSHDDQKLYAILEPRFQQQVAAIPRLEDRLARIKRTREHKAG